MTKRFQQINLPSDVIDTKSGKIYHTLSGNDGYGLCNLLNDFDEYIKELKQEVELLKEGLKAYDENLPLYLTCREIRDFNSDLFEFIIKRQKFYNEHPRLCKIIVDGKEVEE